MFIHFLFIILFPIISYYGKPRFIVVIMYLDTSIGKYR
jgi:hypothetical protein